MRFIGVDVNSFKLSLVYLYRDYIKPVELASKSKSWEERLKELHTLFIEHTSKYIRPIDVVFIESVPYARRNPQTLIKLVHVIAMCRLVLWTYNIEHYMANVSTWKAHMGNAKATKEEVKIRAIEIFGPEKISSLSQDCIDALMIAYYGQNTYSKQK